MRFTWRRFPFRPRNSRGEDRYYHLVLLAENNTGYSNLMKIVSAGFIDGFYYKPRVDMEILEKYHEGIIALSACLAGEVARAMVRNQYEMGKEAALRYEKIFGKAISSWNYRSWNSCAETGKSGTSPYARRNRD